MDSTDERANKKRKRRPIHNFKNGNPTMNSIVFPDDDKMMTFVPEILLIQFSSN